MTDQELREMVRDSMARHLGTPDTVNTSDRERSRAEVFMPEGRAHASHVLLPVTRGGDGDGACLIEPAVRCNHCGYCQSYGH
jgi:hypothetical protein